MGPASAPAVCAGPAVARKASQPPCRSVVPDAPLPEEPASPAHNARAFCGGARAPARARRRAGPLPECHGMSCFVMGPVSAPAVCAGPAVVRKALQLPFGSRSRTLPLPEERPSPAHNARAFRGGARAPAQGGGGGSCGQRRRSGSGVVHGHSCLLLSGPGAGRAVPVWRVSCAGAGAGGRIAAARFARVIARAHGRAAAGRALGAPLPSAYAGAFAAPQPCFLQKSGKAAPEAAFPSCLFYSIPRKVKLIGNKKRQYRATFSQSVGLAG